jgi:hypothetical protein
MFFAFATKLLWVIPIGLLVSVALTIVRHKLLASFPIFFCYTVLVFSRETILLFFQYSTRNYASVYWYGEVMILATALGAIVETAAHLLPQYPFFKVAMRVVWGFGAAAALTAVLMLTFAEMSPSRDRLFDAILLAERSIKFLEASWLLIVAMFVLHWKGYWSRETIGVVAGFGVNSALTLALFEFRIHFHFLSDRSFALLNATAYNLAVIIWTHSFLSSARQPKAEALPKMDFREWNQVLTEFSSRLWFRRY